jgi:A/G-specific adenine glycosylase
LLSSKPTKLDPQQTGQFRQSLLRWFAAHQRDLPWRRTRDPYAIWVSEVMLQQTRVAAAIPYYKRFLARFPTLDALAAAAEGELLAHWAGLGYYYRARNLQKAAQAMCAAGAFADSYDGLRSLPGVGDYTAAAVSSIAFNLPHAVLDGNVLRVLSRLLDDSTNVASASGRKHFAIAASQLLDTSQPGAFNQAMMELGATICLPRNPQCLLCPVADLCRSRASGSQNERPVKLLPVAGVSEERTVFWIVQNSELLVWRRPPESRLMPGFWELPEVAHLPEANPGRLLGSFRHGITFHRYRFEIREAAVPAQLGDCRWLSLPSLAAVPASTILKKAWRAVVHSQAAAKGAAG